MATSNIAIKITQLPNIGNNIAPSTLIPVVNMAGVPTTQKANLQITGNLILAGAGTANFVPAALANLAYTVVNSNQANITRLGTLNINTFNVSGGVNGYILQTDGTGNLAWVSGGGNGNGVVGGSNTQVQFNNAGDFGGATGFTFDNTSNILTVAGNIDFSGDPSAAPSLNDFFSVTSAANFDIVTDNANTDKTWRFGDDGNLTLPANTFAVNYANGTPVSLGNIQSSIANGNSNINIANANGNVVITSNGTHAWNFDSAGNVSLPGNVTITGTNLFVGPGADVLDDIGGSTLLISSTDIAYVQAAIVNVSDIGSADWVAYGHRGSDMGGWIDMGFTSSGYADPNFTFIGPGDGYLFVQSFFDGQSPGGRGGNLILSTGENGTVNDIIFGTGGFELINEFMRISNANNALQFTGNGNITGANIVAANTISLTSGGGGNIESTDNINVIANGNIWTFGTEGTLTLPGGGFLGDYYDIYSANGISIVSEGESTRLSWDRPGATSIGNITRSTAFLDDTGISLTFTSYIAAGSYSDTLWKFGQDGSLTLPFEGPIVSNGSINIETGPYYIYGITGFNGGGADVQISLNDLDTIVSIGDNITDGIGSTYQVTAITGTNPEWTITTSWVSPDPNLNAPYSFSKPGITGGTWQFGNDGTLSLPPNSTNPSIGVIQSANGFPTLLAYGSDGTHGGPELDWMDADDPAVNFYDNTVLRNVMYINRLGLYIGMNENEVVANFSGWWAFGADGTTTFPNNILKTVNGANAVSPGTAGTAGDPLTISAGTGGIAASSLNAGAGGDLTITAGDAGSNIGNQSWGEVGGNLVLRGGNATGPYIGGNVEIYSGAGPTTPGTISLSTGTNQWIFGADGNLTLPANTFQVNYANGTQVSIGGGGANTGNVTFSDINIIGNGNLKLQPDSANASAYLDIFLTAGPDIHIAGNGETVILGTDNFANVAVNVNGNVSIQAGDANGTQTWTFDTAGNLTLPQGGNVTNNIPLATFDILYQYDDLIWSGTTLTFTNASSTYMLGVLALMEVGDAIILGGTPTTVTGAYTGGGGGTFTVSGTGVGQQIGQFTLPNRLPSVNGIKLTTNSKNYLFTEAGVTQSPVLTVDTLPSGQFVVAGFRAFVSDANLAPVGNFGAIVGNSGSNTVSVWCDGTNWRIG
jgi:hypothetical protein